MMYKKPQLFGHLAITAIQGSKDGIHVEVPGQFPKTPPAYEADE